MMVTAFLLGLVGSLHCLLMCGPLVLMANTSYAKNHSRKLNTLIYHVGRLSIYLVLSILFGLFGRFLFELNIQQSFSILLGFLLMITVVFQSVKSRINKPILQFIHKIRSTFHFAIKKKNLISVFAMGAINGLLPCGLVYASLLAASLQKDFYYSVAYMFLFGAGTLPALLFISYLTEHFQSFIRSRLNIINRWSMVLFSLFLIYRGTSVQIPALQKSIQESFSMCGDFIPKSIKQNSDQKQIKSIRESN